MMSNENSLDRDWSYSIESQHTVANTRVIGRDIDLMRRIVWEAMMGVGITVRYFKCRSSQSDFYQDPDCQWDDAINVDAIFEDNPKIKLLKELGWYHEDDERLQLIYLPIYRNWVEKEVFDVKENSLIQVHYFGQTEPAEFRITERKLDSVYGCYYICKLAPERLNNFVMIQQDGSSYLKRRDRPDDCSHVIESNEAVALNGGVAEDKRVFVHTDYDDYAGSVMGGI